MADQSANACAICGHRFRSNDYAPPPEFNPERTQMLTLPPTLAPPHPSDAPGDQKSLHFIEPTMPKRSAAIPLTAIVSLLVLLLAAFVWVLIQ